MTILSTHESLREMQIDQQLKFPHQVIQRMTAQIMNVPKTGETLDTLEYMRGPILDHVIFRWALLQSIHHVSIKNCQLKKLLCEVPNFPIKDIFPLFMDAARAIDDQSNHWGNLDPVAFEAAMQLKSSETKEIYAVGSNLAEQGFIDASAGLHEAPEK